MNYVLIAIGEIPIYIKHTINTILSVEENPRIFLCTDVKAEFKNVEIINIDEIISEQTKRIKDYGIYKNVYFENNQIWEMSLLKIFYLRDFQAKFKIKNFIYFDNDVLIYLPFNSLKKFMLFNLWFICFNSFFCYNYILII